MSPPDGALNYLQFVVALLFVLALIGGAALAARKLGLARAGVRPGRRARLAVIEVLALDAKRRLVLVRRDETEHLLLLGGSGECVVEAGIKSSALPMGFAEALGREAAQSAGSAPLPAARMAAREDDR